MRRVLIFLLILTIPLGFLLGAHRTIDPLQDDVEITRQIHHGDPARVEGIKVRLLTTCGEHMYWLTDYTAGEPGVAETAFHFTQDNHGMHENVYAWREFSFYTTSGAGMSTSGGQGFDLEGSALAKLARVVAENTPAGQTRTETVVMADYVDVFPMEYRAAIFTERYVIEEWYDTMDIYGGESESAGSYDKWMELFRFPVRPEDKMEITVEKDYDGAVCGLNFNLIDGPDVGFATGIKKDGMYFAPVFQTWEGEPIETGAFPGGYGLYYIPFKPADGIDIARVEEDEQILGTFDFDNLELIYPMEPADDVVALELNEEENILHMLTREEGVYRYSALDLTARRIIHQVDILEATEGDRDCSYRFFQEQALLFVRHGNKAALVNISDQPRLEFAADWPQEVFIPLPESIDYRDGVLYMAALDWGVGGQNFYLAALDGNGLGYYGTYTSNLHQDDLAYGRYYVSLDEVRMIAE